MKADRRWLQLAAARVLVRLPDGREGRLVYVRRVAMRGKVAVGGRHVEVPLADLGFVEQVG